MSSKLTDEQKDQIASEIDNQGFGYWVMQYGKFEGEDDTLKDLIKTAKEAMWKLDEYLTKNNMLY